MYETLTVPPPPPPPPSRPAPPAMPEVHIQPPLVYVEPVWEYKAVTRKTPPEEAELNALGAQGWELVGVASEGGALHFYFKRVVR